MRPLPLNLRLSGAPPPLPKSLPKSPTDLMTDPQSALSAPASAPEPASGLAEDPTVMQRLVAQGGPASLTEAPEPKRVKAHDQPVASDEDKAVASAILTAAVGACFGPVVIGGEPEGPPGRRAATAQQRSEWNAKCCGWARYPGPPTRSTRCGLGLPWGTVD